MNENTKDSYEKHSDQDQNRNEVLYPVYPNNPESIEWGQLRIQSNVYNVKELIGIVEELLNNENVTKWMQGISQPKSKVEGEITDSKYT